jgi:hypothetical protein
VLFIAENILDAQGGLSIVGTGSKFYSNARRRIKGGKGAQRQRRGKLLAGSYVLAAVQGQVLKGSQMAPCSRFSLA